MPTCHSPASITIPVRHRHEAAHTSIIPPMTTQPPPRGSTPEVTNHSRKSTKPAPSAATTWMTCTTDGHDHAVADMDFAAGHQARCGLYRAVCGHEVAPCSLATPPGARCPRCAAIRARELPDFSEPHWLGWLQKIFVPTESGRQRLRSRTNCLTHSEHARTNRSTLLSRYRRQASLAVQLGNYGRHAQMNKWRERVN